MTPQGTAPATPPASAREPGDGMLLDVENLTVEYKTPKGPLRAVDDVSFAVAPGEAVGVVGESGCGKSTVMKALLRLLPQGGRIVGGHIRFRGDDVVTMDEVRLRSVRWRQMALITQSAINALNPVYRVGDQIAEVLVVHTGMGKREALERAATLFRWVGLDPKRLTSYPHQLSGGMRQRVMIAMALALEPELVIADEPTTALDVVVQHRILRRLSRLQRELGMAIVFVTHDVSIVAEVCDRALVMYAGKIVEMGSTRQIFKEAHHPYTLGLLNAFPTVRADIPHLISIPGYPPDLTQPPVGCRFAPRCPFATDTCREAAPAMHAVGPGHFSACHYPERAEEFRRAAAQRAVWEEVATGG